METDIERAPFGLDNGKLRSLISGHKDPRMLCRHTHLDAQRIAAKPNAAEPPSNVVPIPNAARGEG